MASITQPNSWRCRTLITYIYYVLFALICLVIIGSRISINQAKNLAVGDPHPRLTAREAYLLCNTLAKECKNNRADLYYISGLAKLWTAIENEAHWADAAELKVLLSYVRPHGNDFEVQRAIAEHNMILRATG